MQAAHIRLRKIGTLYVLVRDGSFAAASMNAAAAAVKTEYAKGAPIPFALAIVTAYASNRKPLTIDTGRSQRPNRSAHARASSNAVSIQAIAGTSAWGANQFSTPA
jgi:hypothetical protein